MYRIMIADDEKKVCQLIQLLGDWERLNIEIIAVCNDGDEALQKMRALRPDIVLTDIRMPEYSGLDLIEISEKESLGCSFIIISGFRQFEYARNAMQFGITDYLLKPIDRQQLNEALARICTRIDEQRSANETSTKAQRIIEEDAGRRRMRLMDYLLNAESEDKISADLIEQKFDIKLKNGVYQALLLNTGLFALHTEDRIFWDKAAESARRSFPGADELMTFPTSDGVYCVVFSKNIENVQLKDMTKNFYYEVKAFEDIYGELQLQIGAAKPVKDPAELPAALKEAERAERAGVCMDTLRTVIFSEMLPAPADSFEPYADRELKDLSAALDSFNKDDAQNAFVALEKLFLKYDISQSACIWQLRNMILAELKDFLQKSEYPKCDQVLEKLRLRSDRACSRFSLCCMMRDETLALMDEIENERSNRESRPVRTAKQYVQKHYSEPLTLDEVAEQAGFSSAYFSSIFKKHTGENFSDFLTEVRLDAAREMLRTTDLSVAEIAEAAGYSDDKYFRKLFKKEVGIKPSEYRKLYF